jgi:hypothetical protein
MSWNRPLLKKLTVLQLAKFSASYGTLQPLLHSQQPPTPPTCPYRQHSKFQILELNRHTDNVVEPDCMGSVITVAQKFSLSGCTIVLKMKYKAWGKTEINRATQV